MLQAFTLNRLGRKRLAFLPKTQEHHFPICFEASTGVTLRSIGRFAFSGYVNYLCEVIVSMRFSFLLTGSVILAAAIPGFAYSHSRRGPTSQHSFSKRASKPAAHPAGQRTIDDGRATQIQSALNGAGYLEGEPTGHWDSTTQAAMQRYQSDNGWQTKLTPDSRAIIKLGLGPRDGSSETTSPREVVGGGASSFVAARP